MREAFGMLCAIVQWWDILERRPVLGNPAEQHAGYAETALTLASRPEAVRMDRAVLSPTRQVGGEIRVLRAGLAEFRDGLVRIPLKTGDVSDTGSMTEADPKEYSGTRDYSAVTKSFAEGLMKEVVEWICAFVKEFEGFKLPPIQVSKEKAEKALKT